jgi:hypothetical protein
MFPNAARFIVALFALATLATIPVAGQSANERPAQSIAREAIRGFKYRPPPATAQVEVPVVLQATVEEPPVMLPAHTVRGLPDRTVEGLNNSFATQERLESKAVWKKDLTKNVRLEVLHPPTLEGGPQGQPRLSIKILTLSW